MQSQNVSDYDVKHSSHIVRVNSGLRTICRRVGHVRIGFNLTDLLVWVVNQRARTQYIHQ